MSNSYNHEQDKELEESVNLNHSDENISSINDNKVNNNDVVIEEDIKAYTSKVEDQSIPDRVEEDTLMLTTMDNPFNPKTDYYLWKQWDTDNGYDTEEYIARLVSMDKNYDIDDHFMLNIITSNVINSILDNDTLNIYRLIEV